MTCRRLLHLSGHRGWLPAAIAAAGLALVGHAAAQTCGAGSAAAAEAATKFTLIARECGVTVAPSTARPAAQMGLYERGSLTITLPPEGATAAPAAANPAPARPAAPMRLPERADGRPNERPAERAPAAPSDAAPLPREGVRILTVAPALTDAARAHGIDPLLMHAIAHVESRHNPAAVSHAGARGVMQVMPATARRFGVGDPERTLLDTRTNVDASAALLRTLVDRYPGELQLVLAAYNAGEGAVERHGRRVPPFRETQAYVRDVSAIYRRLNEHFAVLPSGALVARSELH